MNIFRRKVKLTTVNKVLQTDDVSAVLQELNECKADITNMIVIYESGDMIKWISTKDTMTSKVIFLMESAKAGMLQGDGND